MNKSEKVSFGILGVIISLIIIGLSMLYNVPMKVWHIVNLLLLTVTTITAFVWKGQRKLNSYITSHEEIDTSSVTDQDVLAFMNYTDDKETKLRKDQLKVKKALDTFIDKHILWDRDQSHFYFGRYTIFFGFEKISVRIKKTATKYSETLMDTDIPHDHELFQKQISKCLEIAEEMEV